MNKKILLKLMALLPFQKERRTLNYIKLKKEKIELIESNFLNKKFFRCYKQNTDHEIKCKEYRVDTKYLTPKKLKWMEKKYRGSNELQEKFLFKQFVIHHFDLKNDGSNEFKKPISDYVGFTVGSIAAIAAFLLLIGGLVELGVSGGEMRKLIGIIVSLAAGLMFSKIKNDCYRSIRAINEFNRILD